MPCETIIALIASGIASGRVFSRRMPAKYTACREAPSARHDCDWMRYATAETSAPRPKQARFPSRRSAGRTSRPCAATPTPDCKPATWESFVGVHPSTPKRNAACVLQMLWQQNHRMVEKESPRRPRPLEISTEKLPIGLADFKLNGFRASGVSVSGIVLCTAMMTAVTAALM